MKEFFAKYGGKYKDPYEAIELICHKLYEIKDKVAKADPSHIKDLSSVSDMIDDYVSSIKDDDLKPVPMGDEYQDHQRQRNTYGKGYRYYHDNYNPSQMYRDERQQHDSRMYEQQRGQNPPYYDRDGSVQRGDQHGINRDGFSNPRR